jgi:DNA mismatch repair protein MutH
MKLMERSDALKRISMLKGQDLRILADELHITVKKDGKPNKGWAGHVIERYLGLPLNSAQSPNFGSWELKVVSLRYRKGGELGIKETMAITMIDPYEVAQKEFENSHLLNKLRKILIVGRIFENQQETSAILYNVAEFDLGDLEIYKQVKADYDLVRNVIKTVGFSGLSGKMGILVQPRTKGPGHGSISRAFYARTGFVKQILGI